MCHVEIVEEFLRTYWEADWGRLRTLVTDDFCWENMPSEASRLSIDELIETTSAFNEEIDGGYSVYVRTVASGDVVAQERVECWSVGGSWFYLPCAGFWTLRGARISAWRDYWDMGRMQRIASGAIGPNAVPWNPASRG